MGVFVLLMFQLTIVCFPSSFAEEYKFCDAKPLGKYCLPDNSGWRECLIDNLDEPAEELHHCPAGLKCVCNGKLEQGYCVTHARNPCVRSSSERVRPEFPQSYFGVIFVTDAFCDKDGCEGRIVVSEKYRDNKNGGRSREDLVMGLTQHMTVIIMHEGSEWSQYAIDLKEGTPACNKTMLPEFRGLTEVPENFRFNGTVEILGVECEDWVYEANNQGNFSAVKDKAKNVGFSQTVRDKILTRLTDNLGSGGVGGGGQIVEVHHIYVAKINGTNVPLKVEFAIAIPNQKIFTHYKEFMVAYYPNKSISISSESRIFDLPDVCTNQDEGEGGAIDDVPLDIQTVKRQRHHRLEGMGSSDDEFGETKRYFMPSLKNEDLVGDSSDILEHYRVADHVMQAVQTDSK